MSEHLLKTTFVAEVPDNKTRRFERLIPHLLMFLIIPITLFLTLVVWLSTMQFPYNYTRWLSNNTVSVVLSGTISVIILLCLYLFKDSIITKTPTSKILFCTAIFTFLVGLFWTCIATGKPGVDQLVIKQLTQQFNDGAFEPSRIQYLREYPFQSGFMLYEWAIGKLFGFNNYIVYRLINVVWAVLGQTFLTKIVLISFKKQNVANITAILASLFFPFVLFTNYLYANVPGTALILIACYLQITIIKSQIKTRHAKVIRIILTSLSFGIAIALKSNNLVFLVGIELILLITLITKKQLIIATCLIMNAVCYSLFSTLPVVYVEHRMGIDIGDGIPKISWVAMGLQDDPVIKNGYVAAPGGWANQFVAKSFREVNNDSTKASQLAKMSIQERLDTFKKDPWYAIKFFGQKEISQWSEPTFASLWIAFKDDSLKGNTNLARGSILQRSFHLGILHKVYVLWCDIYQNIILLLALFTFIKRRKKFTHIQVFLALVFLGGFIFHTFWEANPRYTQPYFMMLLPYAALGISDLMNKDGINEVKKIIPKFRERFAPRSRPLSKNDSRDTYHD